MKQYKDDLLASCLQLLLSLPRELVELEFEALVPALQVRKYNYMYMYIVVYSHAMNTFVLCIWWTCTHLILTVLCVQCTCTCIPSSQGYRYQVTQ